MPKRRRIVVTLADTHAGHKLGLLNPDTVLIDETEDGTLEPWTPQLTGMQVYLWRCYQEDIGQVRLLAGSDEIIVKHVGDLTHGTKYPEQLVSSRIYDQIEIAFSNLLPWASLDNVRVMRIIVGTGAHNLSEGTTERIVARMLQERYPDKDIAVLYHSLADVDGVTFDVAHHGPYVGSRDWLRGNVARYYLKDLMVREIKKGKAPPRVVVRAHYHAPVRETCYDEGNGNAYISDIVILPSYSGLSDYAYKSTRSMNEQSHGLAAYEIVNGELKPPIHWFKRSIDLRTKETL